MTFSPNAASVVRDFKTDGVPASGDHEVKKPELRTLLTSYEAMMDVMATEVSASVAKGTKAELDAVVGSYANGDVGLVVLDDDTDLRGVYKVVSEAWVKQADLPNEAAQRAEAAQAAAEAAAAALQPELDSRAYAVASYHPTIAPNKIRVAGYASAGDGGGGLYKKVASEPSHAAKLSIVLDDTVTTVWYEYVGERISIKACGAVMDGIQADTGYTGTDDSAAIIAAGEAAIAMQIPLYIPSGIAIWNSTSQWEPSDRLHIEGVSSKDSTIAVISTITPSVQTNIAHPSDPADPAISALLKISTTYTTVKRLRIQLSYDSTNSADYGADVDVGVFIRSVPFCKFEDLRVTGYWREAGLWLDNTLDSTGATLDFLVIDDACWFQGKWGIRIEGPEPDIGQTELDVADNRGRGGASNLQIGACRAWPYNHHSGVWASDTDGGCARINGKLYPGSSGINAIKGRTWLGTKFQGAAPKMLQIDAAISDMFINCEVDRSTGYLKADGVTGVANADCVVSTSARSKNVGFIGTEFYRVTTSFVLGTYTQYNSTTESGAHMRNTVNSDLLIYGSAPYIIFYEHDQGTNLKAWKMGVSGGSFFVQELNDDLSFKRNMILAPAGSTIYP